MKRLILYLLLCTECITNAMNGLDKNFCLEIKKDILESWPTLMERVKELKAQEKAKKAQENNFFFKPIFVKMTEEQTNPTLPTRSFQTPDNPEPSVSTPLTSDNKTFYSTLEQLELLAQETEERFYSSYSSDEAFPLGKIIATAVVAGVAVGLKKDIHRSPSTVLGILSFLKNQGVNIAAGISIAILADKFVKWLHAPCVAERERQLNEILEKMKKIAGGLHEDMSTLDKKFNTLKKEQKKEHTEFKNDVMHEAQQTRENAVDALVKINKIERAIEQKLNEFEKEQEKKSLKKFIQPLRKELDEIKDALSQYKKHFDRQGAATPNNEAIAILSQEMQRLGENQRLCTPSQSPTITPSNSRNSTLKAPLPQYPASTPVRRKSIAGATIAPLTLNAIQEHLSVSSSETSDDDTTTTPKYSPHRRKSFCFGGEKHA